MEKKNMKFFSDRIKKYSVNNICEYLSAPEVKKEMVGFLKVLDESPGGSEPWKEWVEVEKDSKQDDGLTGAMTKDNGLTFIKQDFNICTSTPRQQFKLKFKKFLKLMVKAYYNMNEKDRLIE